MNDVEAEYPVDEMEQLTVGVAKGEVTKEVVTAFFQALLGPPEAAE